jgi:beta-lactamase regulating signal transducer with metallopeptidase domain/HEAT repeat protein
MVSAMSSLSSNVAALSGANLSMLVLLLKATLILIAALGITLVMQRASAGARHLVWLVALSMLLLVPALSAWGPLQIAILPPSAIAKPESAPSLSTPSKSATPISVASRTASAVGIGSSSASQAPANITSAETEGFFARVDAMSGLSLILSLWAIVVVALGAWLTYGALVVHRMVRRARPLDTKDWLTPLWEVSDRLGLDEPPRLLRSEDARMPFACGVVTPTIVLPAECDNWTADRRLAVLLHELAHVRRHDLVGHTLGRIACAFYWFHPLVWTAAKQLRSESERACDDLALACGARPSDYAEHLLDIVTSVRHDATPAVALAMARRKEFEGRMLAILDPELAHSSPSRWQSAGLIGSLALVALVVGAAAPAQKANPETASTVTRNADVDDQSVQSPSPGADPVAAPVANPAPEYPNSGVGGVASTAGKLIEKASETTRAALQSFTQTQTQPQTQIQTKTQVNVNVQSAPNVISMPTTPADFTARIEEWKKQNGKSDQGRPDDRPVLLANILRTDPDASLRRIAAWGLSEYADGLVATEALSQALRRDSNASVREMAAWALGQGDGDHPVAIDALSAAMRGDSDPKVRGTAIWAMGQIGDKSSMDALTIALSDRSPGIRMRAAWAVGQVQPRQAPKALTDLLRDPDPDIREVAAWALYEIEDPGAIPALDAALRAESDKKLQFAYIRALAAVGEKSVDAVRRLLDSKDPEIRSIAVRALAGGNATGPWPWPWPEPRPFP